VGAVYLWMVPVSYGAAGIVMVVNAAFNGLGRPFPAVVVSILRMVVIYLPLAYAGSLIAGVHGIFVATGIANLLAGLVAYLWIRRVTEHALMSHAASPDSATG
jgi:Na+-driven multidrug efflux pump